MRALIIFEIIPELMELRTKDIGSTAEEANCLMR